VHGGVQYREYLREEQRSQPGAPAARFSARWGGAGMPRRPNAVGLSPRAVSPRRYTAPVDARPFLIAVGQALQRVNLEAVLIGNAAAALQGAPVTTVDFDFMFRKTPRNLGKLKALARQLRAMVLRPYYPAADLYRVVRDDGLQVDFMPTIHGMGPSIGARNSCAGGSASAAPRCSM
jgi:hypothetical protein